MSAEVTLQDAYLVSSALQDLARYISAPSNDREIKDRQKLLRNLRILELIISILGLFKQEPSTPTKPKPSSPPRPKYGVCLHSCCACILHVCMFVSHQRKVCQACYLVIESFLKGDSRKNENYLARFIDFFQDQVRTGCAACWVCATCMCAGCAGCVLHVCVLGVCYMYVCWMCCVCVLDVLCVCAGCATCVCAVMCYMYVCWVCCVCAGCCCVLCCVCYMYVCWMCCVCVLCVLGVLGAVFVCCVCWVCATCICAVCVCCMCAGCAVCVCWVCCVCCVNGVYCSRGAGGDGAECRGGDD